MAARGRRRGPGAKGAGDPLPAGLVLGAGLAGTFDEVVFHQLLAWHHFYDGSGLSVGLLTDGLFHVASTLLVAVGLYALARARPAGAERTRALGAVLVGLGAFNLYDGTVQHKVLGLHQVRRGATSQLPYDAAWLLAALAVLAAGGALLRRARSRAQVRH